MAKLVTGGSGYIGSELVRLLVDRGEEIVVFDKVKSSRLKGLEKRIKIVLGDLNNGSEVMNALRDYKVTHIYHMGALLTFESEANPWASFQTNVVGAYNLIEAARLFKVEKVMFTSSIGTFGENTEGNLTDITIQRPTSFYGVCKLYGEGMGRFYRRKFGMDFRSVRYPVVVGPGVTTPNHWQPAMIRQAVLGKPYQCPVTEDTEETMVYYKDAVRAADLIMQAPREDLRMVIYNIGGTPVVSAKELMAVIKKHIPGASIACAVTSNRPPGFAIKIWDDSNARREWGWKPAYATSDQLVAAFIQEMRESG
jgi:threonine 3-dehydrogenase